MSIKYVAIKIDVIVVVYTVCKYARRLNPSLIHIRGWFYQSLGFFHKIAIYRVHVDFIKIQGVFVKLTFTKSGDSFTKFSSIDCGLISPKFEDFFFVKITS